MYEQLFTQTGLNQHEAAIYELLLKEGELTAGKLAQKSPLKRGLVYKTLEDLMEKKLAEKHDVPGKVAIFRALHPTGLRDLISGQEAKLQETKAGLEKLLPQLTSTFNLNAGKPGVKFFKGLEGAKEVAEDSLSATSEILSYIDVEAVQRLLPKYNESYVARRADAKIKKRMILADTPFARERAGGYDASVTTVRFIPRSAKPFQTVMQIYDKKISYLTLSDTDQIGVLIEDKAIADMHRALFEQMWNTATEFKIPTTSAKPIPPPPTQPAP